MFKVVRITLLTVVALAATWVAPELRAQDRTMTVGAEGELYSIESGAYGDLFPESSALHAETPVLLLDVKHPDRTRDRILVPGTESDDVEDSVSLVFDDSSETLFVLWQAKINFIHSRLNLLSYRNGSWSPMIEIWGSPYGWKTAPQLAVTRDQFVTEGDDGTVRSWARTVVHVLWAEEGAVGPEVLYSPIILLDGEFVAQSPVHRLADLIDVQDDGFPGIVEPFLAESPRIRAGRNGQSVVIGFVDPRSGQLVSMEVEILPGEISHLAERLRRQIIGIGRELRTQPNEWAEELRRQIIGIGAKIDIHPGVSMYVADVVEAEILENGAVEPVDTIADRLRRQIIGIGARITSRGVDRTLAKTGYRILEIDTPGSEVARGSDLIRVSTAFSHSLPPTDEMSAPVSLHLSPTGDNVIISWADGDRLLYRESNESGWSDRLEIAIGSDGVPTLERALDALNRRSEALRERIVP